MAREVPSGHKRKSPALFAHPAFAQTYALLALLTPVLAHASFLSGDALDTAANVLAWFVLIVMPVAAIVGFLYVHVLPEKVAEKREHPHKHSIQVLCILSLFFGGLLWPFAWLWAYTHPVVHRAVYGTEKHEDYYLHMGEKAHAGELDAEELDHLRDELHHMANKGALSLPLKKLIVELDRLPPATAIYKAKAPAGGGA
jgi:CBS domain containing-hemolysin-like protein